MAIAFSRLAQPLTDSELVCAVSAMSEGATWDQIYQMFPNSTAQLTAFGNTARQMGAFCHKWLPDWAPVRGPFPIMMRAVVRNYVQKNHPRYVMPEWMANG